MAELLDLDRLRGALVTSRRRWTDVEHHDSLDSTNACAARLARPWQVVTSDHQSAGRGRQQRSWDSPAGSSLLLSATVPLPPSGVGWVPLLTGLAVLRAVEAHTGLDAVLKWPNDVLLPGDDFRKVAGILCEVVGAPSGALVVIGVGLNVSQTREELPVPTATSLMLSGEPAVDGTALAVSFLDHLAGLYAGLVAGAAEVAGSRAAYRDHCATIGQEVRLSRSGATDVVGRAVAVDDDGRLVIEAAGERSAWAAGDVVHVRPPDIRDSRLLVGG